jgi:hypothetical protein
MTPQPELAADGMSGATAREPAHSAAAGGSFVLNLCSSTTPLALAQTELPELKRFNFFVSRRFEEGRERFRLHMGYFATLAEAEEWLSVVREIYPGAWAGEAPGRKLRERAAAAAAAQAQHAAGPQSRGALDTAQTAKRVAVPAPRPPQAGPPPSVRVPVVHAAPHVSARPAPRPAPTVGPLARRAPAPVPAARTAPPPPAGVRRAPTAIPVAAAPRPAPVSRAPTVRAPAPARPPAALARPRPPAPVRPQATAAGNARPTAPGRTPVKPVFQDSNVREVLAALGETSTTGETRLMKTPLPPRNPPPADGSLSDTQVLRVLEERRPDDGERPGGTPASNIPLLKPDDTGTRRALKDAVVNNAPVWFAVQLHWSVQPVDLEKVPPLAIFSAYTLYTVEGSREGRHWYGLRLGFFSDAISAKQVAYYVRSEFGSVAVVPVSPQERARASDDEQAAATQAAPGAVPRAEAEEFKLIDIDEQELRLPAARPLAPKPAAKSPARAPGAAAKPRARGAGRVGMRERRGGPTLEETLEILGASELTIDDGRGEILNDTGVRHLRVEVQKNSPFSRLLERLSERVKKP